MKTPTLIVRLFGLYMLVNCVITLIQIQRVRSSGPISDAQSATFGDLQMYAIVGVIVGLAGTVFAGFFARLLTFDAPREPRATTPTT